MKEKEDEELFQTDADQRDTRAKATYDRSEKNDNNLYSLKN